MRNDLRYDFAYSEDVFLKLIEKEVSKGSMSYRDMGEAGLRISELYAEKKEIKNKKENVDYWRIDEIDEELKNTKQQLVSEVITSLRTGSFSPMLKGSYAKGKETIIAGDHLTALISKKIKDDILKVYKCYPTDRYSIITRLLSVLKENVASFVIRTDIHHFFESIHQDHILTKLSADRLLPPMTEKLLRQFFYEYNKLTQSGIPVGLPRGIAFSSCLSELYMRAFDRKIQDLPGVYYYARYVDDIVIVCLKNREITTATHYLDTIKRLSDIVDLAINEDKTQCVDIQEEKNCFDYLGYSFVLKDGGVTLRLPQYKYDRYKYLIDTLVSHYNRIALLHTKGRRSPLQELARCLEVLTSNSHMAGRKSFVNTGVYYSHSLMTDLSQWKELDAYLSHSINNDLQIPDHPFITGGAGKEHNVNKIKKTILRKCSFMKGYQDRRKFHGSSMDYAKIMKLLRIIGNG